MICEEYEKATGNKYPSLARLEDATPLVNQLEKTNHELWLQIQVMGDLLSVIDDRKDPDEWIELGKKGAKRRIVK